MASTNATAKLSANLKVVPKDFDPNTTAAFDAGFEDMRDFDSVMVCFQKTVGSGALTSFVINANSQSDGSGTDVEIKAHPLTSQPDAAGDFIFLEATAQEIGALGDTNSEDLRFISATIAQAVAGDEAAVYYIFKGGRFSNQDLTASVIA